MFTFHKPKVFRSANGCCICRAKSSSSRFTDSKRYEAYFEKCFSLTHEHRSGEICNACVLLVKRYIKLPAGSTRHWNHVVDARSGPGIKSMVKSKKQKETSTTKDENETETPEKINKKHFYRSKRKLPVKNRIRNPSLQMSGWLDESIWIKEKVCCGIIFRGPNDMIAIDPKFLNPSSCKTCPRSKVIKKEPLTPLTPSSNINNNDTTTSSRSKQSADCEDLEEMETDDSTSIASPIEVPHTSPLSSLVAAASTKLIDEADDEGFSEKAVLSPSASSCSGTCTPPPSCPSSDPESFLTQQLLNAT